MAADRTGTSGSGSVQRSFPPSKLSLPLAAHFAAEWLENEIGEDDPRQLSVLANGTTIVTDLVGDALQTARTAVDVRLTRRDRQLLIEVSADEVPAGRRGGRNVHTVDRLSPRWGIEVEHDGRTTVWCVLPL